MHERIRRPARSDRVARMERGKRAGGSEDEMRVSTWCSTRAGRASDHVAIELVVQGPHADTEELRRALAVVVALSEGGKDRGLLCLRDRCLEGHDSMGWARAEAWRPGLRGGHGVPAPHFSGKV